MAISSAPFETERAIPMRTVSSAVAGARRQGTRPRPKAASWIKRNAVMFPPVLSHTRCSPTAGRPGNVASVLVAVQRNTGPQGFKLPHDFAAIAASHRGHEFFEIFRSVGERGLDRGETPAFEARRLQHAGFQAITRAERPGQVEARFAADPAACDGGIER